MAFKKQSTNNYLLYDTAVENLFISEYAKSAPGDYVKVYLLGLMYSDLGKNFDNADIAKAFSITAKEVDDAWEYWRSLGIVEKLVKNPERPEKYDIEFISIKENLLGGNAIKKTPKVSDGLSSKAAKDLFRGIEDTTGRLLEAKEPEAVAAWVKDFGIDPSVILFAYDYCTKENKSNRYAYVGKVVKSWNEEGLFTVEQVQEHLGESSKRWDFYKGVFKLMGFRRNPTAAEKELMNSWEDELGLSLSDVETACKKTSGISNPNLKYIDTVLRSKQEEKNNKEISENVEKLRSVEDLYERLREQNAKKTEAAREKIYAKIPGLGDTMASLKDSNIRATSLLIAGNKEDFLKEKENQKALLEKKKKLLKDAGLKETALDPIYSCNICKDAGITEDGRRCSCYSKRLEELKNE